MSVLAGPTCDSIDVLKENMLLPEMEIGDLFLTKQVGAYGWASRTDFNQLEQTKIVNVDFDLLSLQERKLPSKVPSNYAYLRSPFTQTCA